MKFEDAVAYDKKHRVVDALMEAFRDDGGCGHDLGLTGALVIVKAWERLRTPDRAADLERIPDSNDDP